MKASTVISLMTDFMNEDPSSPFLSATMTYELLKTALREVYSRTRLVTEEATIDVVSGVNTYKLPDDFFSIVGNSDSEVYVYRTDEVPYLPIKYIPRHEMDKLSGKSSSYTLYFTIDYKQVSGEFSAYIRLYPTPEEDYPIAIRYIPIVPEISDPNDDIPLPHDLAVPLAAYMVFFYKYRDKDPNFGDKFYAIFLNGIKRYSDEMNNDLTRPKLRWVGFR